MHSTCISENSILFTVYLRVALSWWLLHCASVCSNNVSNFSQNFYWLIIRFITKILQAIETDYNYLCMKCLVTIIIMSLQQNWWEGQSCMMTCSIIYWYSCSWLSMARLIIFSWWCLWEHVQLQQTSTKSGSKAVAKRDGRDSNYNHVSVQNYTVKQSCMHHAVSCR